VGVASLYRLETGVAYRAVGYRISVAASVDRFRVSGRLASCVHSISHLPQHHSPATQVYAVGSFDARVYLTHDLIDSVPPLDEIVRGVVVWIGISFTVSV
jgi:hypothetical protein